MMHATRILSAGWYTQCGTCHNPVGTPDSNQVATHCAKCGEVRMRGLGIKIAFFHRI